MSDSSISVGSSNVTTGPRIALSLQRTSEGWQLTATADNRQSLDKLNHFAPALVERFARASLGHLRVSLESSPQHGR